MPRERWRSPASGGLEDKFRTTSANTPFRSCMQPFCHSYLRSWRVAGWRRAAASSACCTCARMEFCSRSLTPSPACATTLTTPAARANPWVRITAACPATGLWSCGYDIYLVHVARQLQRVHPMHTQLWQGETGSSCHLAGICLPHRLNLDHALFQGSAAASLHCCPSNQQRPPLRDSHHLQYLICTRRHADEHGALHAEPARRRRRSAHISISFHCIGYKFDTQSASAGTRTSIAPFTLSLCGITGRLHILFNHCISIYVNRISKYNLHPQARGRARRPLR